MKKIISLILIMLISINSYAGEPMKKGDILEEDSYVFTVKEATELMDLLKKQEELIEQYKKLDLILQSERDNFQSVIELKDKQIYEYKSLDQIKEDRIKDLQRQTNVSKIERWGTFALGIGTAVGAIYIADKVNDGIRN